MKKFYVPFWRICFGLIALFELLCLVRILPLQPQFTVFGLLFTSLVVWLIVEMMERFLHQRNQGHLPLWPVFFVILALALDALGDFLYLYEKFSHYDAYLHFFSSLAAAYFVWRFLECAVHKKYSHRLLLIFTLCFVTTFGALYEISEYLEDFFTGSHRLGDGFDTANDLLFDFLGASLIVLFWNIQRFVRHRKKLP